MADISLDDFIKKKNLNVKVQLKNPQAGQKRNPQQNAGVKNILVQKQVKNFDARSRLGPKTVVDARDKIIINKKSGGGDARNKIVQKQVQKGTFDARSLLQRQAQKSVRKKGPAGKGGFQPNLVTAPAAPVPLTRTLSNPNAKNRGQVRATPGGLQVTRPVPSTQVSISGSSLQVTKRNKPVPGMAPKPKISDHVPIIQIRNDRYRNPAVQPHAGIPHNSQPAPVYSQPSYREPVYEEYPEDPYPEPSYPQSRGYRDWDDPQYNPSSVNVPDIPKVHVSHLKTIEAAGMRPVSLSGGLPHASRAPPGAATLSQQPVKAMVPKTVSAPPIRLSSSSLKRKPMPAPEMSGPLRLGRGGGPGIDLDPSPSKKSKPAAAAPVVAQDIEVIDLESDSDVISPLQGFRVVVTNLFNGVTQDDIIELFGAVGPLKKAKLLKPGLAEVVYVSKQDAVSAVQKYHSRELDGQPMYVKMTTPVAAVVKKVAGAADPDITGEALRLYKKPSGMGSLPEAPIEVPTIHRALFKAGPPGPNKSVKFTVKI